MNRNHIIIVITFIFFLVLIYLLFPAKSQGGDCQGIKLNQDFDFNLGLTNPSFFYNNTNNNTYYGVPVRIYNVSFQIPYDKPYKSAQVIKGSMLGGCDQGNLTTCTYYINGVLCGFLISNNSIQSPSYINIFPPNCITAITEGTNVLSIYLPSRSYGISSPSVGSLEKVYIDMALTPDVC